MGLKSLIQRLTTQGADTPDTLEISMGYQRKPSIHAACTLDTRDTPCFVDTRGNVQIVPIDVAANDPEPDALENLRKPEVAAPEPSTNPNAWRELAQAYHAHHFVCSTCIAAGRGAMYGLRCGVGAALWSHYQSNE